MIVKCILFTFIYSHHRLSATQSLFTGTADYASVCSVVVKDLQNKVPAEIASDVHDILCWEDAMNSLTVFLGNDPETSAIAEIVS